MAKYVINELSFIDNKLVKEGETIEVDNDTAPALHWSPIDAAAKKAFKAAFPNEAMPDAVEATDDSATA